MLSCLQFRASNAQIQPSIQSWIVNDVITLKCRTQTLPIPLLPSKLCAISIAMECLWFTEVSLINKSTWGWQERGEVGILHKNPIFCLLETTRTHNRRENTMPLNIYLKFTRKLHKKFPRFDFSNVAIVRLLRGGIFQVS